MPGTHNPAKRFVSVSMMRTLYYKIKQRSNELGIDMTTFITRTLEDKTFDVVLPKDLEVACEAEIQSEKNRRIYENPGYDTRLNKLQAAGGLGYNQHTGRKNKKKGTK